MAELLEDIFALIHQREVQIQSELEKLKDFRSAFAAHKGKGAMPAPYERSTAADHPGESVAVLGNTRKLTDAQRKRISRRMKRYWKERNSK